MLDRDYAIQLAMEYGFTGGFDAEGSLTYDSEFVEALLEAIAKEREACADLCATYYDPMYAEYDEAGNELAEAIRARSISRGEA